jgi:hypothetical protein
MTKSKEARIYYLYFHIIGVFIFDFPGQRAEPCSTFAGRTVRINFYFNHNSLPPLLVQKLSINELCPLPSEERSNVIKKYRCFCTAIFSALLDMSLSSSPGSIQD